MESCNVFVTGGARGIGAGIVKALDQQQVDKWRLAAGRAVNDLVELNAKKKEAKR